MNKETILSAALICLVCVVANIPFGMLRTKTKKFSVYWFLCIHAPIPLAFLMRRAAGFGWGYVPLFLVFSIFGQLVGQKLMGIVRKRR